MLEVRIFFGEEHVQSTTYVPEEKEYLANCMKYKFHLKGVFAIPWISQLFWHGICSALEYGQEIARVFTLYIYAVYYYSENKHGWQLSQMAKYLPVEREGYRKQRGIWWPSLCLRWPRRLLRAHRVRRWSNTSKHPQSSTWKPHLILQGQQKQPMGQHQSTIIFSGGQQPSAL